MPGGEEISRMGEGGKGVPAMIEILQGQGAPETREDDRISNRHSAIGSLEEIGAPARSAIPELVEATKDGDAETRVRAAKALVVMGERELALAVLERACADQSQNESVREMARSPEECIFLRTVASSQSPWAERLAVDPSFGYGIFSSHLAFYWHFLVSWATLQFA